MTQQNPDGIEFDPFDSDGNDIVDGDGNGIVDSGDELDNDEGHRDETLDKPLYKPLDRHANNASHDLHVDDLEADAHHSDQHEPDDHEQGGTNRDRAEQRNNSEKPKDKSTSPKEKNKPPVFAIAAVTLGVVGFGIAAAKNIKATLATVASGVLATLGLSEIFAKGVVNKGMDIDELTGSKTTIIDKVGIFLHALGEVLVLDDKNTKFDSLKELLGTLKSGITGKSR